MRRLLLIAVIAAGGVIASASGAKADGVPRFLPSPGSGNHGWGPHASSVTYPSIVPPGWYTNTYNHAWYYPWYAYYNFSQGPYANWMAGGGYAGYAYHGPAGMYQSHQQPAQPYIGEWYNRNPGRPSTFDTLQGNLMTPPGKLDPPKEMKKDEKPKDK